MADDRDASTGDYWVFQPYSLEFRGAQDVPERFLTGAAWEGHHSAGTGYYACSTHDPLPIPVEFNPEHFTWVEIRRNREENNWTAFRIAADDLQLNIPLSTLEPDEITNLLRAPDVIRSNDEGEEGSESSPPAQAGPFQGMRPSTPTSSLPRPTTEEMTDTPERIVVYHDEEVGQLAQRAESLTIENINVRATQMQLQEPLSWEINPVTGHMAGADPADNLAVFRAFGPDRPDPPPHGGRGGGGNPGRGGGGNPGGGPPMPGPGGAG